MVCGLRYLDSTFCSRMHVLKRAIDVDVAKTIVLGTIVLVFVLNLMITLGDLVCGFAIACAATCDCV